MDDIIDNSGEHKPALTPNDAEALIRAWRTRHQTHLRQLIKFHRERGVSDAEIAQAVANCPRLISPLRVRS